MLAYDYSIRVELGSGVRLDLREGFGCVRALTSVLGLTEQGHKDLVKNGLLSSFYSVWFIKLCLISSF